MGFSVHQLCECRGVRGTLVRGKCGDKAAPIVVSQIVGVVVGLRQADADFRQRLTKAEKMEGLGVCEYAVNIKDDRGECAHGDRIENLGMTTRWKQAKYSTGRVPEEAGI